MEQTNNFPRHKSLMSEDVGVGPWFKYNEYEGVNSPSFLLFFLMFPHFYFGLHDSYVKNNQIVNVWASKKRKM